MGTSVVFKPGGRVMCWARTVFGIECSGGMLGALSSLKCWNHLVVDMNSSAMLPRGAAVVGAMAWTQG